MTELDEKRMQAGIAQYKLEQQTSLDRLKAARARRACDQHLEAEGRERKYSGVAIWVMDTVACLYGMTREEMLAGGNQPKYVRPRAVTYALLRRHTNLSMQQIGRMMGHKHYSTVIHAINNVDRWVREDKQVLEAMYLVGTQLQQKDAVRAA